jgi:hypothetical protein
MLLLGFKDQMSKHQDFPSIMRSIDAVGFGESVGTQYNTVDVLYESDHEE